MALTYKWQVTINGAYSYDVEAINSAEAASDAVLAWRKDETIQPEGLRRQMIHDIHTTCLS